MQETINQYIVVCIVFFPVSFLIMGPACTWLPHFIKGLSPGIVTIAPMKSRHSQTRGGEGGHSR